jgi:hypothetical protein
LSQRWYYRDNQTDESKQKCDIHYLKFHSLSPFNFPILDRFKFSKAYIPQIAFGF